MKFRRTIGILGLVAILTGCASNVQATKQGTETIEEIRITEKKYHTLVCYDKDKDGRYEAYQLISEEGYSEKVFLPKPINYQQLEKLLESQGKNISGTMIVNE